MIQQTTDTYLDIITMQRALSMLETDLRRESDLLEEQQFLFSMVSEASQFYPRHNIYV